MKEQLVRNFLGFVLLGLGVGLVLLGGHVANSKLADSGFGFIGMAALALRVPTTSPKDPAKPDATP